MPSPLRPNPRLLSALVLCVAWGGARCAAQSARDAAGLDVLDNKSAARLLVDEIKPEYPPLAKVNYIQGSVRVQLRVTREGHVAEAHIVRGHPFLAEATLQAVRHWIYRPLARGSEVREFLTFVDVKFSLRGRNLENLPPTPEQDLDRQVQPPALLGDAPADPSPDAVRMRVLVGAKGHVLDEE
ncbi:MAG TPA: energy transducer TonB, partial [Terriglobia bacterium]|nr:energy transducer TonB [Terriglobia bacterium]